MLHVLREVRWKTWAALIGFILVIAVYFSLHRALPRLSLFWIFGLGLGLILQRSRFCLVSTVKSCLVSRDTRQMEGMMGGLFIATIGFSIIMFQMMPHPGPGFIRSAAVVSPFGWHLLGGGFLFGFGVILGGGCIVGHLYRLGEGSISSAVAFIGLLVGMGILQFNWPWWWDSYISEQTAVWLPAKIGWIAASGLTLTVIIIIFFVLRYVRKSYSSESEEAGNSCTGRNRKNCEWKFSLFKPGWPAGAGWIALGITNVLMYWILGRPWTVTGEVMSWAQVLFTQLSIPPPPMQAVPGT